MLVTFNPTLTGTDQRTYAVNFMKCVKAIATAAANSTPSVMGMTDAGGVSTTELITAVLANAEAGGWSVGAGDTVPTTTWNNTTNTYKMDLYVQNTGKSTYPYQKYCLIPNPNYSFSSNYTTSAMSRLYALYGVSATSPYSDSSFSAANGASAWLNYDYHNSYGGFRNSYNNCFRPDQGAVTIAVTQNYIHMICTNTSSNGWLSFAGYRETQAWEDNFNDNPPIFGCSTNTYAVGLPNTTFAWMRTLKNDGTFNGGVRLYGNNSYGAGDSYGWGGYGTNYLTHQAGNTGTSDTGSARMNGVVSGPLFNLTQHGQNVQYAPAVDSSTGTLVPCAYPINVATYGNGSFNIGGALKGVYKSLSNGGWYTMTNFYTPGATYTINGDPYYPILTGPNSYDLFLLRYK